MLRHVFRRTIVATTLTLAVVGAASLLDIGGAPASAAAAQPTPRAPAARHPESTPVAALLAEQRAQRSPVTSLASYVSGNIGNWGASGKCIGISGGLAGIWTCTANADQRWHWADSFEDFSGVVWAHLVNGNGQCLAVNGDSTSAGARILGFSCGNSSDQFWCVSSNGWNVLINYNGYYSGTSNDVVGVSAGSTDNGAPLVLWWSDGTPNQLWNVVQ